MRWVVPIAMLLTAAGWWMTEADLSGSASLPADPAANASDHTPWRRTSSGWEKASQWQPPDFAQAPPFHPALLATLQIWTGVAAYVCTRRYRLQVLSARVQAASTCPHCGK